MKVFISWSGEPSQSIACALRGWLPLVVQHVDPWMSNEEIVSGTRWNGQIAEALDQTDFGIVRRLDCNTRPACCAEFPSATPYSRKSATQDGTWLGRRKFRIGTSALYAMG